MMGHAQVRQLSIFAFLTPYSSMMLIRSFLERFVFEARSLSASTMSSRTRMENVLYPSSPRFVSFFEILMPVSLIILIISTSIAILT